MHLTNPFDPVVIAGAKLHAALLKADLKLPITLLGVTVSDGDHNQMGSETYSLGDYEITGLSFSAYLARQDRAQAVEEEGDVPCFANFEISGAFSIDFEGDPLNFAVWATEAGIDLGMAALIPSTPPQVPTPKTSHRLRPPTRRTV